MKHTQRGLSLIELMVSLALGLIITLGVMNIFLSARATYTMQNTAASQQEDARYLLSRISQEIRMAGMFGCLATITDQSTSALFTAAFNTPVSYTSGSTGNVLTITTADVGNTGTLPTWTVLSDCRSSATAVTGTGVAAAGQTAYPIHQQVYTFKNSALYTGTGSAQQVLLSNVSGFTLLFGLAASASDSDTTITSYAETASNPALVRSVRITLKLLDPNSANAQTGLPNAQTYSVVAAMRNRMR